MRKTKALVLLLIAVLLAIVLLLMFLSLFKQAPSGQFQPTPAPIGEGGITPRTGVSRSILSVFPEEDLRVSYLPIQQIEITLSATVDSEEVVALSDPPVQIKIGLRTDNPNILIFSPDPVWKTGVTEVKISKRGASGKVIFDRDFIYKINTSFPVPADID